LRFSNSMYLLKLLSRKNQLSPKIQIFSGVPASFSAQKHPFKILKVLHSQIGQNQKYLESLKLERMS
jgi:hypothetical protein